MLNRLSQAKEHAVIVGVPNEVKDNEYRVALTEGP
jgi:hypothetical protein